MSRICEEFHTDILGARRQPLPTALRIIEQRDYQRAKAVYDQTSEQDRGKLPDTPMLKLVRENESRARRWLIERKRAERQHGQ